MKNLENQKGITLVALVVTIIVLLILAGVSLSLVAGGDGILTRASTAVDETEIAAAKEQLELLIAETQTAFYEEKYVNGNKDVGSMYEYVKTAINGKTTADYTVEVDEAGNMSVKAGEREITSGKIAANGDSAVKLTWDTTEDTTGNTTGNTTENTTTENTTTENTTTG